MLFVMPRVLQSVGISIPVLGWIFLIVHALSARNRHARSFARSYFCGLLIVAIIAVLVAAALIAAVALNAIEISEFKDIFSQIMSKFQGLI